MTTRRPILLTGHKGYIGSVMAPHLLNAGYDVVGLDTGYFNDCTLVPDPVKVPEICKDIRDVTSEDLNGFFAVIHLAALSNDPIGNLDEGWTTQINHEASVRLAELARDAGVRRFLFSSSCIMYGMSDAGEVDENSPLDPQTEYARSKVRSESALRELARDGFSPVYLRNGTIYGVSPRMRFDTVLNNLVGAAATAGVVSVFSDGKPWRPVIHVEDVARSFRQVLEAPTEDIHNEAFNNGADHLNHQVIELAEMAADVVPGCRLEVLNQPGADQRTYKASFAKFAKTFPDFEWKWNAREGAENLAATFAGIGLTADQYGGERFTRLKWLQKLLDSQQLSAELRWT
ncbi:MAG: SDR family oxidoreductase [Alphaproteobacteria bacterium]|nr:SDR family oxidoreductase [Alphaproteobacteria bacterium]